MPSTLKEIGHFMVDYALNLAIFSMAEFYNVEAGFYRTF
jgi:hypothetical protein